VLRVRVRRVVNDTLYEQLMNCTGDEFMFTYNNYMLSLYWTVATVTSLGLFLHSLSTVVALKCDSTIQYRSG